MIHVGIAGYATIQDRGRLGHQRAAVPVSGPADPVAFRAAQALAGNGEADAAIEIIGLPFAFHCDDARIIAVTGRDVTVTARDRVPSWASVFVRSGETVTVSGGPRTRYAYVAVSGGIASDVVLGSRAAYPRAGIGAPLRSGAALALGRPRRTAEDAGRRLTFEYGAVADAIAGPHLERFADDAMTRFFGAAFTIAGAGDRQGTRLHGASVAPREGEILACGVVAGAVQVPRDGQPIVLLADHQTTGGYPVIATVCASDIGLVAQRCAGEHIEFRRTELRDARGRASALERWLQTA